MPGAYPRGEALKVSTTGSQRKGTQYFNLYVPMQCEPISQTLKLIGPICKLRRKQCCEYGPRVSLKLFTNNLRVYFHCSISLWLCFVSNVNLLKIERESRQHFSKFPMYLVQVLSVIKHLLCPFRMSFLSVVIWNRGARKLTGENLKLVWAEFSTLSQAVLVMSIYLFTWTHAHNYSWKLGPGLVLLA